MDPRIKPVNIDLPDGVRCAIALSYDLEMCAGYAPDGINHGRIIPPVQEYTLRLCAVAESFDTKLHFFQVCNGLEEEDIHYLQDIVRRGHVIDSHTYSHVNIAQIGASELDEELSRANRLLAERLGVCSTVLRGPFGYKQGWRSLPPANREVILKNGFRWVSGQYDDAVYTRDRDFWVRAPERDLPYSYPEGLMEIPFQGWSDRMWFDLRPEVDQTIIDGWRRAHGHKTVLEGWRAPWTRKNALQDWIALNRDTLDFAYEHRLFWVPVWHPYTHYLHDPEHLALRSLLQHATGKPERVWVCTVRDLARHLRLF